MIFHSERQKSSILQAAHLLVHVLLHVADGEANIKNGPQKDNIRRWKEKPVALSDSVLHARTSSI